MAVDSRCCCTVDAMRTVKRGRQDREVDVQVQVLALVLALVLVLALYSMPVAAVKTEKGPKLEIAAVSSSSENVSG